jgi:hypothetical protein
MSNLNSKFDVVAGFSPHGKSAMDNNFKQKDAESPIIVEGMIVAVEDESGVPVVSKLTSAAVGTGLDYPWLCIQGMDQSDAAYVDKVTVLAVKSGVIFKVETSESFTIGDLCMADAGVLKPLTVANEQAIGQIIDVNSAAGWVVVASVS